MVLTQLILALLLFVFLPSEGETKKLRVFPQMYKKEYECFSKGCFA